MEISNYIAAIDLGSSKIVGIIGSKSEDNIISVYAVEKESSDACIKRGCIQNVEETALKIKRVISRLEARIKSKIDKIYIGIGGQSIHSIDNKINHQLNEETPITAQIIDTLKEISMNSPVGNKEVLEVLPSEYLIDGKKVIQPIGVYGSEIEVTHKLIVGRASLKKNIQRVFEKLDVSLAGFIIAPLAASSVMTEAEKNLGAVLVDFGAETTTVSIYKDGLLRYLAVIPIGGKAITKDIASLQILEEDAEKIKFIHGDVSPDIDIPEGKVLNYNNSNNNSVSDVIKIYPKTLHKVILARTEEIVENINNQIRLSGYDKQQLGSGIIITGGASRIKNFTQLLIKKAEMDVKFGEFNKTIQSQIYSEIGKDPHFSVLLGTLLRGEENCRKVEIVKEKPMEKEPEIIIQETVSNPAPTPTPLPSSTPVAVPEVEVKEKEQKAEEETVKEKEVNKFHKFVNIFTDIFTETSKDEKLRD